jgi:predicted  nucleic acid-binding Zn-ribbon protein
LKKVSEASREVFFSEEHKADKLQYKIDQLELTIEKQFNRLRENPNDRARIALQPSVPTEKAYISRQYSSQIQSIQDKVQRLSDEISFSRVAVASRLDSLEHNVDIVRGNVNHLVERAQLINHQATTIVSPTPAGSTQETEQLDIIENKSVQPIAKDNTTTTVPSKRKRSQGIEEIKQDPLHKMVEHLG